MESLRAGGIAETAAKNQLRRTVTAILSSAEAQRLPGRGRAGVQESMIKQGRCLWAAQRGHRRQTQPSQGCQEEVAHAPDKAGRTGIGLFDLACAHLCCRLWLTLDALQRYTAVYFRNNCPHFPCADTARGGLCGMPCCRNVLACTGLNIRWRVHGRVAELADALDLGSSTARCAGSTPASPTIGA